MFLPERDKYSQKRRELEALITSLFGGRIAEEIVFGKESVTTGAADDIRRATDLARRMVTEWGMSDKLGPLRYEDNQEEVFLGHSVTMRKNLSEQTASAIDGEIRRIVQEGEARARKIITERLDDLHAIAKGLLEYETLSADEIRTLLRGDEIYRPVEPPVAPKPDSTGGGRRGSVPKSGSKDKAAPGGLSPEPQPGG